MVGDIEAEWYPKHWMAAGEPSLFQASRQSDASSQSTYRFTWLRSFHAPVIVRIERLPTGSLRLFAKQLSGKGGYESGTIASRVERNLNREEERVFYRALAAANDLRMSAVSCEQGSDGAAWIMEANDRGRYRYVNRWAPEVGPIHDLGLVMLRFTGWRIEPVY